MQPALTPDAPAAPITEVLTRPAPMPPLWLVTECADGAILGRLVRGHTKGEARAALKRQFGRLPDGTELERREERQPEPGARPTLAH